MTRSPGDFDPNSDPGSETGSDSRLGPAAPHRHRRLAFGDFHLDRVERKLYRDGEPVELTPTVFELLTVMLERPGEIRTREELFERVWPDRYVEDGNLTQTVFLLRRSLGDDGDRHRYIVTEVGKGYRFVREVREVEASPGEAPASAEEAGGEPAGTERYRPPEVSRPISFLARGGRRWVVAASALLLAVAALTVWWYRHQIFDPDRIHRIAVLPFVELPSNRESPLGYGFADTVSTEVASRTRLEVRPLPTVVSYTRSRAPVTSGDELARLLEVDAVVLGTILREEERVQVSVRVVADDHDLWADSYTLPATDLFELQGLVADGVADVLEPGGRSDARRQARRRRDERRRGTTSFAAYEYSTQGRYHLSSRTGSSMLEARASFARALEIDPGYADAWSDLAVAELLLGFYGVGDLPVRERYRRSRVAAHRALEIRPDLATPHTVLGMIHLHHDYDLDAARSRFRQGLALAPASPQPHHWYAWHRFMAGEEEDGIRQLDVAGEMDPMSLIIRSARATAERFYGAPEAAVESYDSILAIDPEFGRGHLNRGLTLEQLGRHDEAEAALERAREILGRTDEIAGALLHVRLNRGDAITPADLATELATIEAPIHRALVLTGAGRQDEAIEQLIQATRRREMWPWYVRADPRMEALRRHPEFRRVEEIVDIPLRDDA